MDLQVVLVHSALRHSVLDPGLLVALCFQGKVENDQEKIASQFYYKY